MGVVVQTLITGACLQQQICGLMCLSVIPPVFVLLSRCSGDKVVCDYCS